MEKFIPLSIPNFEGNEEKYVLDAVHQGWVSTGGAYIVQFEEKLAAFLGVEKAAACQSGTSALHLALVACNVKPGDLVIVPTVTFIAAVNPVKYQFAEPVFMDCDDSLCMNPEKLRSFCEKECALQEEYLVYKKTGQIVKAVVVVHVFGNLADMEQIMEIAGQYHLKVIEDATEALGSHFTDGKYAGKMAGTIGDYGAYSFNGNKIITGSAGGCFLTDDEEAANKVRKWSTQARENAAWYQHEELGYNYRMSNVVAGVVRGQFPYLKEHIAQKKAIYERYKEGLKGLPVSMNPMDLENSEPNYWLSCMIIDMDAMCKQVRGEQDVCYVKETGKSCPTEILEAIASINAEGRPIWKPMHMQPIYRLNPFVVRDGNGRARSNAYIAGGVVDVGMDIFTRGLCLPSDNKMTAEQQDRIIEVIKCCFE